jgi:hypothetical protein
MTRIVFGAQSCQIMGANGLPYNIIDSEAWAATDPLVVARPDLFTVEPHRIRHTVQPTVEEVATPFRPLERAVATPGLTRNIVGKFQKRVVAAPGVDPQPPEAAEGGSTPATPEGASQRW